jgi:predicted amidohydrolase
MTLRFGAACVQLGPAAGAASSRREMKDHLDYATGMVDKAIHEYGLNSTLGAKLIVMPELAVYGWPAISSREMHERFAIEIPGPETERFVEKAREYDCYICPGTFAERDPESSRHLVFNTQVLVGPAGVLCCYRKMQPWWPEEASVSPHDLLEAGYDVERYPLFPVVETEVGRIGGFVCYDALFPEVARQLAYGGCEIFLGSTAYMDPWGRPPLDFWNVCCRARSIENMAYGVHAGSGVGISSMGNTPTSGGSFICDFEGRVLAQSQGPGETMTYATLDLDTLRDHRKHTRLHNTLVHLRAEAYDYLDGGPYWEAQPRYQSSPELNLMQADELNCAQIERFWGKYYGERVQAPTRRPAAWAAEYREDVVSD